MSAAAQLSSATNVVVGSNSNNSITSSSNNNTNQTLNTATAPSAIPTAKRPLTVISESANPTDNGSNSQSNNNNNVNSNNIVPSVTLNRVSFFLLHFLLSLMNHKLRST